MSGPNGDPHVLGGGTGDDSDDGGDTFEEEGAWGTAGPPSRRGSRDAGWPGLGPWAAGGRAQVYPDVLRCAQMFCRERCPTPAMHSLHGSGAERLQGLIPTQP